MTQQYKPLDQQAVRLLESQGCTAESWSQVQLSYVPGEPLPIWNVRFSGEVRIGILQGEHVLPGGCLLSSGISNVTLHQVTVGDGCCIDGGGGYIANYDIGDEVLIRQVGMLLTEGTSRFGQGTRVAVLRESGGREVAIHDTLTAQEAHLQALYTDHPAAVRQLHELVERKACRQASGRGFIGKGSVLLGCQEIRNVWIGEYARLSYASRLVNGTLSSCKEAPCRIGSGVMAEDFVCTMDACVDGGARLHRCFVGEGTHIGNGFSAVDTLFFANCQAENGEACALFAGPFTVSHHKSTLLIGMMTSFMNAGSGSNQSNHAYKLGPLHQGILDRGTKTGSSSYLLWPARVGAYSIVLGHHTAHFNTEDFPFSYLMERDGRTWLMPGAVLNTVGLKRDLEKWPLRDHRRSPDPLDIIHYESFTPYTLISMQRGIQRLEAFLREGGEEILPGVCLSRVSAEKGIRYYKDQLLISGGEEELSQPVGLQDLSGCYVESTALEALLAELEAASVDTLEHLHERIRQIQYQPQPSAPKAGEAYEAALQRARRHLQQDAEKEACRENLSFDDPSAEREQFLRRL